MNLSSSDDESSDSSHEYLVEPGKLDFNSSFFQASTSKSKPPAIAKNEYESSSDSDDEFVNDDDNKINSTALLAEVMKNLEKANNVTSYNDENAITSDPSGTVQKSPKKEKKEVLSDEIANLLMQGESGVSSSSFTVREDDDDEEVEEAKPLVEYTIPKEGVNITLPGTSMMMFNRNKKRGVNLDEMLRKKMNQKLRSNQVFIHKVGLLCWLAHGIHLNKQINDPEVLSTALSLVPSASYPKGRVDLKYLEQFTKWFKNQFKIEFKDIQDGVRKETLLIRLNEKKVHNYRELVLLYAAALRAIGLNCRIVVSLCPPALKVVKDQLFQTPASKEPKKEKDKEDKVIISKKAPAKKAKGKTAQRGKSKRGVAEPSPTKVVPENSTEVRQNAKLEARKKAAEVLAKFSNSKKKKSIKTLANKSKTDVLPSPEKIRDDDKPKSMNLSPSPRVRELRSRVVKMNSQSTATKEIKKVTFDEDTINSQKSPGKRTRATRSAKAATPATSANEDDCDDEIETKSSVKRKKTATSKIETIDDTDSDSDFVPNESVKNKNSKRTERDSESESDSADEFRPKPPPKKKKKLDTSKESKPAKLKRQNSSVDRRCLSSDEEPADIVDAKGAQNIWVEVYVEAEENWICVSVIDNKIHCVNEIYKKAPKPVLYVVAWNSVGSVKDVTRRYCPNWLTVTRKQRVDEKWWLETLLPWKEKSTALSRAEDESLLQRELEQPLPKTVGECKGHPLYALARHLLKFEALYPPDAAPLGYLKTGEAIYSRHCVHTLCSRETWIKKARVVKPAQESYKIVKAMPKYDKLSGNVIKDQPLELFGKWQTTQYVPPVAKDGKVPRNEYGNVDLFKECMLPKGTVHIDLPALNRVARKLGIDCVPAVVGFNFGGRGALPAFEGYVVCEEFEDTLREAWEAEQIEARKRAKEKRLKRIYGNWKKLVKGLFIRERLAARYAFNQDDDREDDKASASTNRPKHSVKDAKKSHGKKTKHS